MTDDSEIRHGASIGYAVARFERALRTALEHADSDVRARAEAKAERWRGVIEGMASGRLWVGSRTPVADTPAWVTLEVAHGGFATGRYLAEGELLEHEQALLGSLPAEVPGETPRERLNGWYLGDGGQAQLSAAVNASRYHVEVPEEGALPVVVGLLERGRELEALELIATLRPLMHRLRFYPKLEARPRPAGSCVYLSTVGSVARRLEQTAPHARVLTMNEALGVWAPLFDRLVALWLDTVEDGWPCRRFPTDWVSRREAWLADHRAATAAHPRCGKHRHRKSNYSQLHAALERCPVDSSALDGREVGRIRRVLANTLTKLGAPGSARRTQLRRTQAEVAARPLHSDIARLLARRISAYPANGGLPSLSGLDAPARAGELEAVAEGTPIPASLFAKLERAVEAPIAELVERGVITSSEVLATVLPQVTAQVVAAGIDDPVLRELFGQIYAAFRRRRSLLLLDLQHQIRIEELPWVAALESFRRSDLGTEAAARQTLEDVVVMALSAFPQTLTPNPLVRELGALAEKAALALPLVEEVAADIFMGVFTSKWLEAAERAATLLDATLYARYYDLPLSGDPRLQMQRKWWGKQAADGFTQLCRERAHEAGGGRSSWVAGNGAVIEQSQILTTHNLAVLVDGLGMTQRMRPLAAGLTEQVFAWIVDRQLPPANDSYARLRMVKNVAYAWRQAIFWLSLCERAEQGPMIRRFGELLADAPGEWARRLMPVHEGLRLVYEGGRFDTDGRDPRGGRGRRLLGWSVGPHWLLG